MGEEQLDKPPIALPLQQHLQYVDGNNSQRPQAQHCRNAPKKITRGAFTVSKITVQTVSQAPGIGKRCCRKNNQHPRGAIYYHCCSHATARRGKSFRPGGHTCSPVHSGRPPPSQQRSSQGEGTDKRESVADFDCVCIAEACLRDTFVAHLSLPRLVISASASCGRCRRPPPNCGGRRARLFSLMSIQVPSNIQC